MSGVDTWTGGPLRVIHRTLRAAGESRIEAVVQELGVFDAVPFGPGLALLQPCEIGIEDLPGVVLEVGVRDGAPVCRAVRSDGRLPLTTTALRRIKVETVLKRHLHEHTVKLRRSTEGEFVGETIPSWEGTFTSFEERTAKLAAKKRKRRRGPDELDLTIRRVAEVFRTAQAERRSTAAEIAKEFDVSKSTARKWVMKARARGLLEPPVRGMARIARS